MEQNKIKIKVVCQLHPQTKKPCYIASCPTGEIFGQTFAYTKKNLESFAVPELINMNIEEFNKGNAKELVRSPLDYEGVEYEYIE